MSQKERINKINHYVKKLSKTDDKWQSLAIAIGIADEIMKGILPKKTDFHDQLNHYDEKKPKLPDPLSMDIFRTQKQETWFAAHPTLGSARVALNHFSDDNSPIESRFFLFSEKHTKQKVSATTQLVSNWEDSNLTRNDNYKIAVDFFLTHDANTLMIVLTNSQKLRVMELNGTLSNTQKHIFVDKLFTISYFDTEDRALPQKMVHDALWYAFQLKEVNNKFYQGISIHHYELVSHLTAENDMSRNDAQQFSTRLMGRLLFIWFLRKMELINEDMNYFETIGLSSTEYYKSYLEPLFFHTLNTPIEERIVTIKDVKTPYLNGGLFEMKENDYYNDVLNFPENYFTKLYNHFNEFNFTVDESSVDYELVAVDPEMLGQVFESLLAAQDEDNEMDDRKSTGSFYTPRHIVDYMSKESIRQYLYREIDNPKYEKGIDDLIDMTDAKFVERKSSSTIDLWGTNTNYVKKEIKKALDKVKIIDPAVGSGAFPMGILQIMSKLYERILPVNRYNSYKVKSNIIENNIYGVDIQPMATEISRLRAWLAIIVDDYQDNQKVNPLPNLEFKFVSANSLVELETQGEIWADPELGQNLSEIRQKYFNARTTQSKAQWKNKYYTITGQTELFEDKRNEQLKSFDPFSNISTSLFFDSEIMFGISDGFDIVIGNPPYIHFQKMDKKERDFYKNLGYETYVGRGDIYVLFYELGMNLLIEGGILSYITSNKWMRSGYGKKLRNYFIEKTNPLILIDLGEGVFEHATVDTNILIIENRYYPSKITALTLKEYDINKSIMRNSVKLEFNLDEIWTILNPIELLIKTKVDNTGKPLKKWNIKIRRGITTGLDDAFIISEKNKNKLIKENPNSKEVIHPIVHGRDVRRNSVDYKNEYILFIPWHFPLHEDKRISGASQEAAREFNEKYPAIYDHLSQYKDDLKLRNISETGIRYEWYALQRYGATYYKMFYQPKIIYAEIVQSPRFYLDNDGSFFANASAFVMTGEHLEYLVNWLNSDLVTWIFKNFYAGGGLGKGFRYKRAFLDQLPIPYPKEDYEITEDNVDSFIIESYGLTDEEVEYIRRQLEI